MGYKFKQGDKVVVNYTEEGDGFSKGDVGTVAEDGSRLPYVNFEDGQVHCCDEDQLSLVEPASTASDALSIQEGGTHYKKCGIQPVEYIQANNLDFFQGSVIKYTTRHKDKGGKEDIKKAIHFLQLILELQYGK